MKIRLHLSIVAAVLIIGLIAGSFYDLQISQAIFQNRNGFGITVTAFALLIGYGFISFTGGILFKTTLGSNKPKWARITLYVLSFASIIIASYFAQKEIFSVNGFDKQGAGWVVLAWSIALIIQGLIFFAGFKISKNYHNDKYWIVCFIIWAGIIISLILGVIVIKDIVHRPRYRTVQLGIEGLTFHNWWEPFKDYKSFITDTITKEEFKSFPSGHAGTSCLAIIFAVYIPYIVPMKKRTQIIIFYVAVAYFLLVCFVRVFVGAHFLSDVCFGGLLTLIISYIGYEVCVRKRLITK